MKRENFFGGRGMTYYGQNGAQPEENPGTVYHAGNGFYSPYAEPLWKKEKRLVRSSGNGIGMASIGYVAISFFASAIYALFTQLLYPGANIRGLFYGTEAVEWGFTLLVYVFSLLIPFGIYALAIKMPFKVALPFRRAKTDLTIGGVFVGLGACVAASYATSALQYILELIGIGITMPEYDTPETAVGILLYFIALAIAPAFIEEMIFRGIVMQSLRRFGDVFALVASALIFGIFHLNLIQMPYAFIAGLAIGYFVMRTGSLWVGIIIHFINNATAVVFEFFVMDLPEETQIMINLVYNLISVILAVIALAALLMKYKDMFRFEAAPGVLSPARKAVCFITSPALIIAAIGALIMTAQYVYLL